MILNMTREDSSNTSALAFLKLNMNIGLHKLEADLQNQYFEDIRTGSTVASSNQIPLPENVVRSKALYVTVGSRQYPATEIFDEETWRRIQASSNGATSDVLRYYFVRKNYIEVFPTPASVNTYTLIYETESKDLAVEDYTTGTISALTNGAKAVTGSGTTFTASMVGRFMQITSDGEFYEIASYTSATAITLVKSFQGTTIAAGSEPFTIGQMPRTPGPTHVIPVYYAAWQYYLGFKPDDTMERKFKKIYMDEKEWATTTYQKKFSTDVIPDQRSIRQGLYGLNPNLFPRNIS
jgi:hypothetical protein